ncbi:serine hydrolase [Maribacter algarum]|uniref:Serine hydrolase n=1 Tax=Maribacter algarum (ex Zhang et al. 2020) TaxID=2578118 RepID=A0A5S3PRK6_9FLAO|nr:serine hydrolase [Maribacter algarum]TMM57352.1 serine hydrolase [Maribacter algarum]
MKIFKRILLALLVILAIAIFFNYPKLNIVSGYASKNLASTHFIADRLYSDIVESDNNMELIELAEMESADEKSVITSVFGLMERETVCRDGLGCVLINKDYDKTQKLLKPTRTKSLHDSLPFPYGNNGKKDTVFANIDYEQLNSAVRGAFENYEVQKTRTVLVTYKGQIVAEEYIEGFSKDTPILGWSMTKSVLATLYGILQHEEGLNLDLRPFDTIPVINTKTIITLNDLLRMQSGLEWDEDYGSISDVTEMLFLDTDMTAKQGAKKRIAAPAEVWNYSSGTTNLLSGILRKEFQTHQDYLNFPYTALIDKIGMHSMLIETDMAGNFVGSSYGWATTRDWAKFGILHLNKGNWNGEQLFAPKWIDYITKPTEGSDGVYGAHWWLNAGGKYPDVPRDLYSANGFQGQRVFIIPSKDLVIVRTGLAGGDAFDANTFLKEVVAAIE